MECLTTRRQQGRQRILVDRQAQSFEIRCVALKRTCSGVAIVFAFAVHAVAEIAEQS
jgi:hypothetical protein